MIIKRAENLQVIGILFEMKHYGFRRTRFIDFERIGERS